MTAVLLKITGGTVYDPANGIDGVVRDLWISGGKLVEAPSDSETRPARTIDAKGLIVMPGGVDMHCHIVGSKVNAARMMCPEHGEIVPTTTSTGLRYAGLGYTTAFDAAIAPLAARHAHEELVDTPCIDRGFFALMGNNHYIMRAIRQNEPERLKAFVGWLLDASKGFGAKLVNPGGVENWKNRPEGNARDLDARVDHFEVTPGQILASVARAVDELRLPHPVHVHTLNLGLPGNWTTTLQTMKRLEGHRAHLAHIQFHSYDGGDGDESTFGSKVGPLVEYLNDHPNLTADVGQIVFGPAIGMTADGPVGHFLGRLYGSKWYSNDIEQETGCGVAPIEYRNTTAVHAWQWAIGLEWFLRTRDPWQIAMSTDHPNGGSFLAYPRIIKLLMDATFRKDTLATLPAEVREQSVLRDLDRQYSLSEIAIITRAGPARMLGLTNKGHLGLGADADVTIYTPDPDPEVMFALPRYVIHRGLVVVEQGEIRETTRGRTLHVEPDYDRGVEPDIQKWFEGSYSIQWRNYPVEADTIGESEVVP